MLLPENRSPSRAYLVGRWLIEKSAERIRKHKYCASRLDMFVRINSLGVWQDYITFVFSQDTFFFLREFKKLWDKSDITLYPNRIDFVGVRLSGLIKLKDRSGEFFLELKAGEKNLTERLSSSVDNLNIRYGKRIVNFGVHREHPGFFERE